LHLIRHWNELRSGFADDFANMCQTKRTVPLSESNFRDVTPAPNLVFSLICSAIPSFSITCAIWMPAARLPAPAREVWLLIRRELTKVPRVRAVADYLVEIFRREKRLLAG
jgi:hypothetical protein